MKNITTLDELIDKHIGKEGTPERAQFDNNVRDLLIGYQLKDARIKLDLTQEELAERVNKKRTYISRVENDCGNITIKSLRDIVEKGLGGKLEILIHV